MSKVIIYPNEYGGVSVLTPILESGLTIDQIAKKDVPPGTPFKIVDSSEIPEDLTFRDAWEYVA